METRHIVLTIFLFLLLPAYILGYVFVDMAGQMMVDDKDKPAQTTYPVIGFLVTNVDGFSEKDYGDTYINVEDLYLTTFRIAKSKYVSDLVAHRLFNDTDVRHLLAKKPEDKVTMDSVLAALPPLLSVDRMDLQTIQYESNTDKRELSRAVVNTSMNVLAGLNKEQRQAAIAEILSQDGLEFASNVSQAKYAAEVYGRLNRDRCYYTVAEAPHPMMVNHLEKDGWSRGLNRGLKDGYYYGFIVALPGMLSLFAIYRIFFLERKK